jgi:hypothetical protein
MDELVGKVRVDASRNAKPSYGLADSQSVKATLKSEERGSAGMWFLRAQTKISVVTGSLW